MIIALIYLIIFTSQHVHGKVITINTTGGSDIKKCCMKGECPCSSLSTALQSMTSNTVINITTQSVTLHNKVTMGLHQSNLNAITIIGNGSSIMCNNSGSIYCESCHNLVIKSIKMYKCGYDIYAGLEFKHCINISIFNCEFRYSKVDAVALYDVYHNIVFNNCNFVSKNLDSDVPSINSGFSIYNVLNKSVNLVVHRCNVSNNGIY